jgi:hypothetical protein
MPPQPLGRLCNCNRRTKAIEKEGKDVEKPAGARLGEALTDKQLVRRILAGETALFEILVHRHSQKVYRAARSVLGRMTRLRTWFRRPISGLTET